MFALVLETVRWRGLRSLPARNGGVGGAPSRSGRLLPRAWRRERWSRRSPGGRIFAPARSIAGGGGIRVGDGFAQVLIAPVGDGAGCPATPAIEIEFAGKARMRIPASIPTGLAAAVVKALSGR